MMDLRVVSSQTSSALHAPDTSRQLDAARLELIRRRVIVFTFAVGALLILLGTAPLILSEQPMRAVKRAGLLGNIMAGIVLTVVPLFRLRRRRETMTLNQLVRRTTFIVVLAVAVQVPAAVGIANLVTEALHRLGFPRASIGAMMPLTLAMLLIHLSASIIIPWTPWEAARPVLATLLIAAVGIFTLAPDSGADKLVGLVVLALAGVPGILVAWFRHGRLRELVTLRFLNSRWGEVQRELNLARRIHEKFFPQPDLRGPVRFDFRYEPMREIGGDFVEVVEDPATGSRTIVLIDVNGHGIAAALSVNRLHGEIKRILASDVTSPDARSPARVLAALNTYIHLTLADAGEFATALALRVDPMTGHVQFGSAGHPPALVRRRDGSIEVLDSTAMMLGVMPPEDYEVEQVTLRIQPGDVLLAYTDGAIECHDARGQQLGIAGLRRVVESLDGVALPAALDRLSDVIRAHRRGEPEDDTLLLGVCVCHESPVDFKSPRAGAAPVASVGG
jgi:sigma-B regulation protein RsbU (phosphoserine phosphatase)